MEMGRSGNGGGKVVTFDDAVTGRRRNGSLSSSYLDMVGNKDAEACRAARPLPAPGGMGSRRRTYADGELDVFTAERYFKGAMDGHGPVAAAEVPPVEAAVVMVKKPSSTRASTVSLAASSASSANSQTVLVRGGHHRRRGSRDRKCCVQVGVLMRTCSGKRSVRVDGYAATKQVHDDTAEPAASRIDWYRELRMQKAALGLPVDGSSHGLVAAGLPPAGLSLGTAKVAAIGIGRELMARDEKGAGELTCSSSMRRSSSFALVAPVRASVLPASDRAGDAARVGDDDEEEEGEYDGAGSESSSDLFEIKSLMIEHYCPYEPSEASIQWSVVTASAAGASEQRGRGPAAPAGRQQQHHRPAGLLAGCASHRAVDVSAAATRAAPSAAAAMRRRSDGFHKARNGA